MYNKSVLCLKGINYIRSQRKQHIYIIYMYFFILRTEPRIPHAAKGRLTERLLAQGLLTPAMLRELQKEWNQQNNSDSDDEPSKTSRRKRRK